MSYKNYLYWYDLKNNIESYIFYLIDIKKFNKKDAFNYAIENYEEI